ncbi:MAG: CBS domain-containing protein, partial [Planctomycetes bacterium]|nr:CBS domain-containing protein [Planctomycetota bacterium]
MVKDVRTVPTHVPALRAAKTMTEHGIRHLIVTDDDGRPVGILTQRDVLKYLSPWLSKPLQSSDPPPAKMVRELMSTDLTTVTPDTPLAEAAGIFASTKLGCLPVLDAEGSLIGI